MRPITIRGRWRALAAAGVVGIPVASTASALPSDIYRIGLWQRYIGTNDVLQNVNLGGAPATVHTGRPDHRDRALSHGREPVVSAMDITANSSGGHVITKFLAYFGAVSSYANWTTRTNMVRRQEQNRSAT
jgi:hypothetical protein